MAHLMPPGQFHDVEGADDIAVQIGAGVLQRIAHPGLRGEMDDHLRLKVIRHPVEQGRILQLPFGGREIRMVQQHLVAALFEPDVVIVRHPVIALHQKPLGQQQLRQMITDEPGGSRDQHSAHRHVPRFGSYATNRA